MSTLKQTAEERVRFWQRISEIADDAEAVEVLRSYFGGNGNRPTPTPTHDAPPDTVPEQEDANSGRRGRARGALSLKVEEIVMGCAIGVPFTSQNVLETMVEQGFQFTGDPKVPINDALRYLEGKELVRVAERKGVVNYWVRIK